jgi:hypothetical protein
LLDDTITVNQQQGAGDWNVLGTYDFTGLGRIVILSEGGCSTSADALRLVHNP